MLLSSVSSRVNFDVWKLIALFALFILIVFLIYPMLSTIRAGFISDGHFSIANYKRIFYHRYYWTIIGNTLLIGILAVAGAELLGITLAYIVTRTNVPGKSFLRTFAMLPMVMPTLVGAQAWIMLLGYSGILTKFFRNQFGIEIPSIYGWHGILLVLVLQFYPFVFSMVSAALRSIDRSLEESAENLGASWFRKLRTITLPLVLPAITSAGLLVFMYSVENFAVPVLIGRECKLLSVEIYNKYVSELGGNPGMASALGMVLILITIGTLFLQRYIVSRKEYKMASLAPLAVRKLSLLVKTLATFIAYFIVFISLFPFIMIFYLSFVKSSGPVLFFGQYDLGNYITAFSRAFRSIENSYFLATISTIVGIVFAILVAYVLVRKKGKLSGILDFLVVLPLGIPGIVLGISLIVAFNKGPLILTGTWMILALSYFLRKTSFAVKAASSVIYQLDPSLEEASMNLGVSPMRTFSKITVPLIVAGIISGATLMWITTICELSSTIVLYYGPWATMPIQIFERMSSGEFGVAAAFASMLAISVLIPLLLVNKIFGKTLEIAGG